MGVAQPLLPEEVAAARGAARGHPVEGRSDDAADGRRGGLQGQHQDASPVRRAPGPRAGRRRPRADQAAVQRRHDGDAAADALHTARVGDPGHSGLARAVAAGRPARRCHADSLDAVDGEPGMVLLPQLPALVRHRARHDGQRQRHAEPAAARGRVRLGRESLGRLPGVSPAPRLGRAAGGARPAAPGHAVHRHVPRARSRRQPAQDDGRRVALPGLRQLRHART